jgi:eukaryotic-like serine/threonine-protein kinase
MSGVLEWTFSGNTIESSPAIANGVVYVGSNGYDLYALNALSGTLLWTSMAGNTSESSPAIVNGVVYIGSAASFPSIIYAFHIPGTTP